VPCSPVIKVKDIRPGEDGYNVIAKVVELNVEEVPTGSGANIKKTLVRLAD
jgi:hypothetical protein